MPLSLLQKALATVQISRGAFCIAVPGTVQAFGISPEFQIESPVLTVAIICMGIQAVLAGLLALTTILPRRAFLLFGLGVLPLLGIDYYFYVSMPLFTELVLLDFIANIILLALCIWGFQEAASPPQIGPDAATPKAEAAQ